MKLCRTYRCIECRKRSQASRKRLGQSGGESGKRQSTRLGRLNRLAWLVAVLSSPLVGSWRMAEIHKAWWLVEPEWCIRRLSAPRLWWGLVVEEPFEKLGILT